MKKATIPILFLIMLGSLTVASYTEMAVEEPTTESKTLLPSTEENESLIAFNTMMDVLTHQRCVNCHPSDDVPKQGEDSHAHRFGITRANGIDATNCKTCHQSSNNEFSGVPGAPEWSLAPHKMRWEGLSRIEIAKSVMNPENNGNRTPENIMHHLTEHELVLWAWEPGVGVDGKPRELPPVPVDEYIAAVKTWIELGAQIPKK